MKLVIRILRSEALQELDHLLYSLCGPYRGISAHRRLSGVSEDASALVRTRGLNEGEVAAVRGPRDSAVASADAAGGARADSATEVLLHWQVVRMLIVHTTGDQLVHAEGMTEGSLVRVTLMLRRGEQISSRYLLCFYG